MKSIPNPFEVLYEAITTALVWVMTACAVVVALAVILWRPILLFTFLYIVLHFTTKNW